MRAHSWTNGPPGPTLVGVSLLQGKRTIASVVYRLEKKPRLWSAERLSGKRARNALRWARKQALKRLEEMRRG